MNRRLGGDTSLNAPVRADTEAGEWQDWLVDDQPTQEERLGESQELDQRRNYLSSALSTLNDRERRIFEARRLAEEPATLEDLSSGVRRLARAHPPDRGAGLREGAEGGPVGRARRRRQPSALDRGRRRANGAAPRYCGAVTLKSRISQVSPLLLAADAAMMPT